jgi:competence protein ComEC
VRLSWYDAPALERGQRWAAEGKLRPPWGYRNPGGFDYERWLLGAGINGTGYVRSGKRLEDRDPAPDQGLNGSRRRLKHWLESLAVRHTGLIQALMIGDDTLISQQEWSALRASGTIHLLVVSGLHIGFVAGVLY